MSEEEEIEQLVKHKEEEVVKEEVVKEEVVKEEQPKAKAKTRAKPKIKIVKESVESVVEKNEEKEEQEEQVEKPKKVDKLKQIVKCPDCNMEMTLHTFKYIHKRRGFCKSEVKTPEVKTQEVKTQEVKTPEQQQTKITQDIVNDYIKENPDIISNYLRNERAMKAQRKQMNARSLLNNAF